jgi:hypothetical protein
MGVRPSARDYVRQLTPEALPNLTRAGTILYGHGPVIC